MLLWKLRCLAIGAERPALASESLLEPCRAVAVAARPGLRAVQIAAAAARMRILDFFEDEVFLPVPALFGERRVAEAHFHPLHTPVVQFASDVHVAKVFGSSDGAGSERSVLDRLCKRAGSAGLHPRSDEVAHTSIVRHPAC